MEIDRFIAAAILTENFKLDGTRAVWPVLLYIPLHGVDRVGGDRCAYLATPSVQPCLWYQFIRSTVGKDTHCHIIIIRIDHLKIQFQYIGTRALSNPMNYRLGNRIMIVSILVRKVRLYKLLPDIKSPFSSQRDTSIPE